MRVTPKALMQPSAKAASRASEDRGDARQRQIGDVDVGLLQREEGDHDAGRVGDRGDERSISAVRITKVRPVAMIAVTETWRRMLPRLSSVTNDGLGEAEDDDQEQKRHERRDVAQLTREPARARASRSGLDAPQSLRPS